MVRNTLKKINILGSFAVLVMGLSALTISSNQAGAVTCSTSPCEDDVNFRVNIPEILEVSVTTPQSWASGDINTLLRNLVSLQVTSNNGSGFATFMSTKTNDTDLSNTAATSSSTIPTLGSTATNGAFPANFWGYSLDDTAEGLSSSSYNGLVGKNVTPIKLTAASLTQPGTASEDIYFGAKANASIDSGTYSNTVVISVVSGMTTPTPTDPTDPETPIVPTEQTPNPTNPTYDGENTVYTTIANSGTGAAATTTTTTTINSGDTRSSYTAPQGVTNTVASINEGTPLATGLAVTAAVAAASGVVFFVVAKRHKDDDEEDDYYE